MVGVAVADQDRVNLFRGRVLEQVGKCRVARVQQQAEALVLDEVPAARLARRGPRAATTEDGDLQPPPADPPPALTVAPLPPEIQTARSNEER